MEMSQARYQALMDHIFKNCPSLFLTFHEFINLTDLNEQGMGNLQITRPPNVNDRDYKDICAIASSWK